LKIDDYWHKDTSQTTLNNAKVIKRIDNWTVEVYESSRSGHHELVVSDGYHTYYPIIYEHDKSVAYDHPYYIPTWVRKWIRDNADKLYKLLKKLDEK